MKDGFYLSNRKIENQLQQKQEYFALMKRVQTPNPWYASHIKKELKDMERHSERLEAMLQNNFELLTHFAEIFEEISGKFVTEFSKTGQGVRSGICETYSAVQ